MHISLKLEHSISHFLVFLIPLSATLMCYGLCAETCTFPLKLNTYETKLLIPCPTTIQKETPLTVLPKVS